MYISFATSSFVGTRLICIAAPQAGVEASGARNERGGVTFLLDQ
jgi:hypothetical protein